MSKFKVGDKVKTRDGLDVEIIHINEKLDEPIVGILHHKDGIGTSVQQWSEDGKFVKNQTSDSDIFPLQRTVVMYRSLVRTPNGRFFITAGLYQSEDSKELQFLNKNGYKVVRLLTEYPVEVEE